MSLSLERADRGAIAITTELKLVIGTKHQRTLNLPAPMRDAKTLRTLIVLDLESHPPAAGIDEVGIEAGVAPGRIVQGSLLDRALPSPETIATLTARLGALAGRIPRGRAHVARYARRPRRRHDGRSSGDAPARTPDAGHAGRRDWRGSRPARRLAPVSAFRSPRVSSSSAAVRCA